MKKFLKQNLIKIIIIALPLVGIAVFLPLMLTCVIDTSVFLASIFSVLAVMFAVITFWQSQRLNETNNKSQQNLTRAQIDHEEYIEAKNSIVEAIAVFDMQRLAHAILDYNTSTVDDSIKEMVELLSETIKAKSRLFLNSSFTDFAENEPCFKCPKSSKEHKTHVMAAVLFRNSYEDSFNNYVAIFSWLIEFYRDKELNTQRKQYLDAMRKNLAALGDDSNLDEVRKIIEENIAQTEVHNAISDVDLTETRKGIRKFFDRVSHEMKERLSRLAKKYISSYARAMKMNFHERGRHEPCPKKQTYINSQFEQIEKDFAASLEKCEGGSV